jgi:hypothetical protein
VVQEHLYRAFWLGLLAKSRTEWFGQNGAHPSSQSQQFGIRHNFEPGCWNTTDYRSQARIQ